MAIVVNWTIGVLATLLLIYASVITIKASKKLDKELKVAVLCLFWSILCFGVMGLFVGVMATKGVIFSNFLWTGVPILSLIGSLLFVCGARKLFRILLGVSDNSESEEVKK
jgi:hypothetical protein